MIRIIPNTFSDVELWTGTYRLLISKTFQVKKQPLFYFIKVNLLLSRDQLRLYTIIWEAFVSSQMNNAKSLITSIDIKAADAMFRVSSTKITEKGFYSVIKLLSSKEDVSGDRQSTRLNSSHIQNSRMPSSA